MTLAYIVVEHHLRLGDGDGILWTSLLLEGCHVVDLMMGAEYQYRTFVTPHHTT